MTASVHIIRRADTSDLSELEDCVTKVEGGASALFDLLGGRLRTDEDAGLWWIVGKLVADVKELRDTFESLPARPGAAS